MGSPFDEKSQVNILRAALQLLEQANQNGIVQDYYNTDTIKAFTNEK